MGTLLGMKDNFGSALSQFIEFEYDVVEACEVAIFWLEDKEYKEKINSFKKNHLTRIAEGSDILIQHHLKTPTSPSLGNQWVAKGKVVFSSLVGDKAILRALQSIFFDMETEYGRLNDHAGKWADCREFLEHGLKEVQKEKNWLEYMIDTNHI